MLNAPNQVTLEKAMAACLREFPAFVARFKKPEKLEATRMETLGKEWDAYYFGTFASFDQALRAHVMSGGRPDPFVQLSIDHHNLHRLMEVLRLELGSGHLGDGRIPERLVDLTSSWQQLDRRLADASGAAPRT
jgi:hypothetical protein